MWTIRALPLAAAAAAAITFGACRNRAQPAGGPEAASAPAAAPSAAGVPAPIAAVLGAEVAPGAAAVPSAGAALAAARDPAAASSPIDLSGIGHDEGSPTAKVAIVEFADFGCPYCAQFARDVFPTIRKEYIETGKVRWKFVPFVMGMFPNGAEAARASECAAAQGETAFWGMYDRLFARQPEWKATRDPSALFARYAGELHLNAPAFAACYRADAAAARTRAANHAADQLGLRATPTFFVNGAKLEGALPLQDFRMVLRQAGAP